MNCKPGDLAVIVRVPPTYEDVLGRIVRVIKLVYDTPPYCSLDGLVWSYEGPNFVVMLDKRRVHIVAIADECLQPIRGASQGEETETQRVLETV